MRVYATMALASVYLDQAYQAIINDLPSQPGLRQISLSYGLGETYMPQNQMQTDDQYFAPWQELASAFSSLLAT